MWPYSLNPNAPPRINLLLEPRVAGFLILLITILALCLRLYGLDWDQGNFYHPDERSIYMRVDCMYETLVNAPGWQYCINADYPTDHPGFPSLGTFFDESHSPLNPHWFPLGSILLYALLGIRAILGAIMDSVSLHDLALAGRSITAIIDTASIPLIYALGRRVYGTKVGLLAALLCAFAVVNIQLAHFYRPEPFLMLLALGSFWFMLNTISFNRWRDHLMLGAVIGLSFSVKASSAQLLIPLAFTYGLLLWQGRAPNQSSISVITNTYVLRRALAAGLLSLAVFAFSQPYALLDFQKFIGDITWEGSIASSAGKVPYTIQYIGTVPGWYELRQTSLWALGLPLGILAWIGLLLTILNTRRKPSSADLLFLSWVIPSLLLVFSFEVKFLRYIAPVLPLMILFGSNWLVTLYLQSERKGHGLAKRISLFLILSVVVSTGFYALAFASSYTKLHPAVQASDWINTSVPDDSKILTDNHWDEGFPRLGNYRVVQLPMYETDTSAKMDSVSRHLASADYLIAYSNRPFGSIARQPNLYPLSSAYYKLLFNRALGYDFEKSFDRYPSLLGVSFIHDPFSRAGVVKPEGLTEATDSFLAVNLGYADENVTNYDRPLVLVFRNTGRLTSEAIFEKIMAGRDSNEPSGLMLTNEALESHRAGGTWTDLFGESGWTKQIPLLLWLLLIEFIMLIFLPFAIVSFRWLPDRGVVLARPLGILVIGYVAWLGASIGWWSFSRNTILIILLVFSLLACTSFLAYSKYLFSYLRSNWRYMLSVEVLFLVSFLLFAAIRAANPDLWHPWRGGEKPMDLSYLTAIIKSSSMPPYDPWFAGGYINYYYFGLYLMAFLIKTTGIVPSIAYNLAIPLLFAMTLTAAFSISYNLAEALRRNKYPRISPKSTFVAGLTGAMMVAVLGNLDGMAQVVQGSWQWAVGNGFPSFDFWRSSRLMPGQIAITEFPFWSFLFADLHAHVISIPFALLALGITLNVALTRADEGDGFSKGLSLLFLAASIGALAVINTWEAPTYLIIGIAGIGIAVGSNAGRMGWIQARQWLIGSVILVLLAYILFLPFHLAYETPTAGLKISQWKTVFWHYIGIHGLMFFVLFSWLVFEWFTKITPIRRSAPSKGISELLSPSSLNRQTWKTPLIAIGFAIFIAITLALLGWETVGVLLILIFMVTVLAGWWIANWSNPSARIYLFLLLMAALALGIGLGVDFITVGNDIDRMNTVFKFYLQAWTLYGVLGGVLLWHLWVSGRINWNSRIKLASRSWITLLALLIIAASVYPILGTRARSADRFQPLPLTLNGEAYQAEAIYTDPGPSSNGTDEGAIYSLANDTMALQYMRRNIHGSPVVLEAVTSQYRWTPRVAKYTGLPVVVGWEFHQTQQRDQYRDKVYQRVRDVTTMYQTADETVLLELLRKYSVEYIYVGATERLYYHEAGLKKFEHLTGDMLSVFYKGPETIVYKVSGVPRATGNALQHNLADGSMSQGAGSLIEDTRDILIIIFSVLGIAAIIGLWVLVTRIFGKVNRILDSAQEAFGSLKELTETAVEGVAKPLAGNSSLWSIVGGIFGFFTGLNKQRNKREGNDKRKSN